MPTCHWAPPYPAWYNPNVECAYHSDVAGHSTENCIRLRQKIYELIDAGSIKLNLVENEPFKTNGQPKIDTILSKEGVNFLWIEKDDQEIEQICKPGDRKEDAHITVTGDGTTLPHV